MQAPKIYILLIDDDEEDFIITRDIIGDIPGRNYQLDWAPSYEKALAMMAERKYDVYLVDYRLGAEDGLNLIREAVRSDIGAPMILLTGQGDLETDEMAMKAGASDYLVNGTITSHQLERSIRYSINDYKNLNEIKKLNQGLEKRVEERTRELEEAVVKLDESRNEIIEALQKEKELNELKSRFVSMASHEFRTPLSTILSSTTLLEKYSDDEPEKKIKHFQRIKASIKNLIEILESFLSLSKLEEGRVESNPSYFEIDKFGHELVEDMGPLLAEGQQINYKHTGAKEVFIDKQMLHNILLNLLSNAIKYSPPGKEICFTSEIKEEDIIFKVKDSGIGIPEDEQKHLFERFFRARNVTNIQGTGLGLNIVKKYVELLGGNINFESRSGEGTTFTVMIPIADL